MSDEPVITSYAKAPNRTVTTSGTTFAYRELGPRGGIPVVFFGHLAATLDNGDPRIIDPIAKTRHVIAFDNVGVEAPRAPSRPPSSRPQKPLTGSSECSATTRSTCSRSPWAG